MNLKPYSKSSHLERLGDLLPWLDPHRIYKINRKTGKIVPEFVNSSSGNKLTLEEYLKIHKRYEAPRLGFDRDRQLNYTRELHRRANPKSIPLALPLQLQLHLPSPHPICAVHHSQPIVGRSSRMRGKEESGAGSGETTAAANDDKDSLADSNTSLPPLRHRNHRHPSRRHQLRKKCEIDNNEQENGRDTKTVGTSREKNRPSSKNLMFVSNAYLHDILMGLESQLDDHIREKKLEHEKRLAENSKACQTLHSSLNHLDRIKLGDKQFNEFIDRQCLPEMRNSYLRQVRLGNGKPPVFVTDGAEVVKRATLPTNSNKSLLPLPIEGKTLSTLDYSKKTARNELSEKDQSSTINTITDRSNKCSCINEEKFYISDGNSSDNTAKTSLLLKYRYSSNFEENLNLSVN